MCEFTKNYYIYTSCLDPGAHFIGTSVDGMKDHKCSRGPHERYIVVPGHCPLCTPGFDTMSIHEKEGIDLTALTADAMKTRPGRGPKLQSHRCHSSLLETRCVKHLDLR
ncbi:hypothetical protein BKA65DRAFT_508311 [Rhexocercosporidium sp. MPI-PUGE-AT-0058]|nr:hypothetical protein BKA65DRAFT_508311 [Rhexocercosporidium sp. MPI-PUGE-AT-0058]